MVLVLENITKKYNNQILFDNVNLDIQKYGLYYINGESGSGKTTLLSIIGGYEGFEEGKRRVDNSLSFAYIFQNFELIQQLTISENISLYQKLSNDENPNKDVIIEQLGLNELLDHFPHELSHGQQQRVAIARALMQNTDVILCDEPTESLDNDNKEIVMKLLKKLSINHIVIVVSHDQELMKNYYDCQYQIMNHVLKLVEDKNVCEYFTYPLKISERINNKYLLKVINKITLKRNCFYYGLILFFTLFIFISMRANLQLLDKTNIDIKSLNDHTIYVTETSLNGAQRYIQEADDYRKVYAFENQVAFEEKTINLKIHSLPKEYHKLNFIAGDDSQEQGIIINQFAAQKIQEATSMSFQDMIGKTITLKLGVNYTVKEFNFPISGIVEEYSELYTTQLYYPYETVVNELKHTYINESNSDLYTYYHTQYNQGYELFYDLDKNTQDIYQQLQKSYGIICMNDLLEITNIQNHYADLIQFIFQGIIYLLIGVIIVFISFFAFQDYRKQAGNFAIINALNISLAKIERNYVYMNRLLFIITMTVAILLVQPLYSIFLFILTMFVNLEIYNHTQSFILNEVIMSIVFFVIYTCMLYMSIRRYHHKSMSAIMKENKDM